jgi:hypothetical protein
MKIKKGFAVGSILVLTSLMAFGQGSPEIRLAISAAQMIMASNGTTAFPIRLGLTKDGKLLLVDSGDRNNEKVVAWDITTTPPTPKVIVTEAQLKAKIDAVNGADPAPQVLTIQSVDVDGDGDVIILTDGSNTATPPEYGYLFNVNPQTSAIKLLSGLDAPPGLSSVEGNRSLAVSGETAYITVNDRFGAVLGDAIVRIDADGPDGGKTAAEQFTSNDQLLVAIPSGDIDVNDIAVNPKTGNLVAINSGTATSNDDILEIDIITGVPRVLVSAADIKADLGTSDVGYSSIGADADGAIYLSNQFGPSGDPTNRAIIAIKNPGNGAGDASLPASQAQIVGTAGLVAADNQPLTDVRYQNSGLVVAGGGQAGRPIVYACATTRRSGASSDTAVGVISVSR